MRGWLRPVVAVAAFVVSALCPAATEVPDGATGSSAGPAQRSSPDEAAAKPCFKCHGDDGADTSDGTPYVAGQSKDYLVASLLAYQSGARTSAPMRRAVRSLTPDGVEAVARYFASLPRPVREARFDAGLARRGRRVHESLCEECHTEDGRNFRTAHDPGPVLAGQSEDYLRAEMEMFLKMERGMPAEMGAALFELRRGDLDALIQFYIAAGARR